MNSLLALGGLQLNPRDDCNSDNCVGHQRGGRAGTAGSRFGGHTSPAAARFTRSATHVAGLRYARGRRCTPPELIFANQNRLKLVAHRHNGGDEYEHFAPQEHLVYRTYNLLTDMRFRVRLAHITYVDTEGGATRKVARTIVRKCKDR